MFVILVPLGALLLARRNLRLGRGDRQGALRIAGFLLLTHAIVVPLTVRHFADLGAFTGFFEASVALILFRATLFYLFYLAMEPYVRKRWPETHRCSPKKRGAGSRSWTSSAPAISPP